MSTSHLEFENRIRRLLRKHLAMTRGYTTRMRPDGLIVAQPRRAPSPISLRAVVLFFGVFVLFKGFLIASLGPTTYDERLGKLEQGNIVEQAGAFAIKPDPLTTIVAAQLHPVLR